MTFIKKVEKFLQDKTKIKSIDLKTASLVSFYDGESRITIDLEKQTIEITSSGNSEALDLDLYIETSDNIVINDIKVDKRSIESFMASDQTADATNEPPIYYSYMPPTQPRGNQQLGEADETPPVNSIEEEMHPLMAELSSLLKTAYWRTFFTEKIFEKGVGIDLIEANIPDIYILKLYDDYLDIPFALEISLDAKQNATINYIFIGDDGSEPVNSFEKTLDEKSEIAIKACLELLEEKIALHVTKTKDFDHENSVIEMASSSVHNSEKGLTNQDSIGVFLINSKSDDQRSFSERSRELITEILDETKKNINPNCLKGSGSTFCGVAFKKGKTSEESEIFIGHLGDSRPFLTLRNALEQEVLISLTEDAEPDVKRFRENVEKLDGVVLNSNGVARVGGILNMASAFGDNIIAGVEQKPEFYQYNLGELLKRFPELADYQPVKLITVSDGITKLELIEEATNSSYPTPYYKVECAGKYGDTSEKKFIRHDVKPVKNFSYSAQNLITYTVRNIGFIDDNAAAEIDLTKLQDGQEMFELIGDGHGKDGHDVSRALKESAVNNNKLVQLPNHASQETIHKAKEKKEHEISKRKEEKELKAGHAASATLVYSTPIPREKGSPGVRHRRSSHRVTETDVAAAIAAVNAGKNPTDPSGESLKPNSIIEDKERDV